MQGVCFGPWETAGIPAARLCLRLGNRPTCRCVLASEKKQCLPSRTHSRICILPDNVCAWQLCLASLFYVSLCLRVCMCVCCGLSVLHELDISLTEIRPSLPRSPLISRCLHMSPGGFCAVFPAKLNSHRECIDSMFVAVPLYLFSFALFFVPLSDCTSVPNCELCSCATARVHRHVFLQHDRVSSAKSQTHGACASPCFSISRMMYVIPKHGRRAGVCESCLDRSDHVW